jgi:hypothetical protein
MDPVIPIGTRGAFPRPLGLALLLLLAACASAPAPKPPSLPGFELPPGHSLLLRAAARGVQIYLCQPKATDPAAFEWTLKAPEAELSDVNGVKIGKHYAGPTWESLDGSKVVGEVVERKPMPDAIPWLLLRAKANEGTGIFAGVKYIQRVDTKGGVAPAGGCDATAAGTETRVDYSANYDFYVTR